MAFFALLLSALALAGAPPTFQTELRFGKRIDRGPGSMNYPSGITVDPDTGDIYVNDLLFNRIQHFSAAGQFINQWNRNLTLGIDWDPVTKTLWTAVWEGNQIARYDATGKELLVLGSGKPEGGETGWNDPHDVSVDIRNGNVYVLDSGNRRVVVLDKEGQRKREFPINTLTPFGIALHPKGDFLVISDPGVRQVMKYSLEGKELQRIGGQGSESGQMRWCRDVTVDNDGNIYVADTDNERGQKLDSEGKFIAFFQGPNGRPSGAFHPRAIEVNLKTGELVAAAAYANRIDRFNPDLSYVGSFGGHEKDGPVFNTPRSVAVSPKTGDIYVGDWFDHRIRRFDKAGKYIQTFDGWAEGQTDMTGKPLPPGFASDPETGMWVSKEDQFFPAAMQVDSEGNLWVLREVMHYPDDPRLQAHWVVRRYTADGKFIDGWGNDDFPQSAKMRGLILDEANKAVYIANSDMDKVMRLDMAGGLAWSVGGKGTNPGLFNWPAGIALDQKRGRLYVADTGNHRIQVLDPEGKVLSTFGKKGTKAGEFNLGQYSSLALDAAGNLYVGDVGNGRIQVFDPDGKYLTELGKKGTGGYGKWGNLSGIAIADNRLVLVDTNGYEVEVWKIDPTGKTPTTPISGNDKD